jgi:hypothetical protein
LNLLVVMLTTCMMITHPLEAGSAIIDLTYPIVKEPFAPALDPRLTVEISKYPGAQQV